MRVLVITVVHTPLDARIHHRQIRSMRAAGWEITYAAPFTATGTPRDAVLEGVSTIDLPRAVGRRRSKAVRSARRLIDRAAAGHDVVLLHDPELILAVAGRRRRVPVVLDVHEDLAGSLVDRAWLPDRLRPVVSRVVHVAERWAERNLTLLLAERRYEDRFDRPHPLVRNLPWLPPDDSPAPARASVVYVGRISAARGAAELIDLGRRLHGSDGPRLELVGPADAEVVDALEDAAALGHLSWHGFEPSEQALTRVDGAVAGLSLLHDVPNYRVSLPTKVVEYLSRGVPVITTPLPEAVSLLEACGGGIVVPFGDVAAVHAAVRTLHADPARRERMGVQGRAAVADGLTWDAEASRFLDVLRAAAR